MQLKMNLNGGDWGGLRKGAGRKRSKSRGVAHRSRLKVGYRTPLHINFRYRISLRNKETLRLLKRSINNARSHGLKILQFSFQSNHVHLIVEAHNNAVLTKGMRSLTITFAKGLCKGRVQIERYHLHILKTVREVKNALHYVLFNQQKHELGTCTKIDEFSSLLSMKNALELVKKFAIDKRVTVVIEKNLKWESDQAKSYLYQRGLAQL